MRRHHVHAGVLEQKLLLFPIVLTSIVVILMAYAVTAYPNSRGFNLEDLKCKDVKFKISSQHSISFNGLLSIVAKFLNKIWRSINPKTKEMIVKHFEVIRIAGDGRCMFRSLVKGMAANNGVGLDPLKEMNDADKLRVMVKKVICDNDKHHYEFKEAITAITLEESLSSYCERIKRPNFWGGESELLVISKMFCQPITVYIPETTTESVPKNQGRPQQRLGGIYNKDEKSSMQTHWRHHARDVLGFSDYYIPIVEYGAEFKHLWIIRKHKKVVRLAYNGRNHYDLLV